jgi:superfamily II DNA helicase RecQ
LIQDQIDSLNKKNISAIALTGQLTDKYKVFDTLLCGKKAIIYSTPEFIMANFNFFHKLISKKLLNLVAIDESHCISSWGQDFRANYLELTIFKENFPDLPILALTATATQQVKYEIVKFLKLSDPEIIQSTFDRPNLNIYIYKKD